MYQNLKEENFEAFTLIELIEHIDLDKLPYLVQNLFGFLRPNLVVITTPNSDFNVYFNLKT
jgi:hypothetical protein